jgi:hypothetical protein
MKLAIISLSLFSFATIAVAADTPIRSKRGHKTPAYLTCYPGTLLQKPHCETAHLELSAGTWDSKRQAFTYRAPAGWHLTGAAGGSYYGREVFDVTVLGIGINAINCQWHTEGSKQLGGPGGYVNGYCYSEARQGGPE